MAKAMNRPLSNILFTPMVASGPGEKFSIPGNSKFEIRVAEAYHYICHFG